MWELEQTAAWTGNEGEKQSGNPQLFFFSTVKAKGYRALSYCKWEIDCKNFPSATLSPLTTRGNSGIGGLCSGGHLVNKHQPLGTHKSKANRERKKKQNKTYKAVHLRPDSWARLLMPALSQLDAPPWLPCTIMLFDWGRRHACAPLCKRVWRW